MSHPSLLDDAEFKDLVARKNRISLLLTGLTLVVYYGFILLVAFKRDLFGVKLPGGLTLGIPLGIGVIVLSSVFTGIYVRWANRHYDAMVENLKRKAGHGP